MRLYYALIRSPNDKLNNFWPSKSREKTVVGLPILSMFRMESTLDLGHSYKELSQVPQTFPFQSIKKPSNCQATKETVKVATQITILRLQKLVLGVHNT